MNSIQVKLNDLPDLPFEKILGYLSLEDRIKARGVSRRWHKTINSFRPKCLCYSIRPSGLVFQKSRWISGTCAQNFIWSPRFESFFETFGKSILSNLKHLRLFELYLKEEHTPAFSFFNQILNSFVQLEELDLFGIDYSSGLDRDFQLHLRLNLPMLKSIYIRRMGSIRKLTLDAPILRRVKHFDAGLELKLNPVHCDAIEKLMIYDLKMLEVKNLKNLKYLFYCGKYSKIESTLLSALDQLEEIHLDCRIEVAGLFEQKKRYGLSNLKIFLCGCLLNDPNDPAIESLNSLNYIFGKRYLSYLAENPSKMAEEIPLIYELRYSTIAAVAPGLEIDLLKRFTNLERITVYEPIKHVDRFLKLLKNLNNISSLKINYCAQPQQLFDQLPNHCNIQWLKIKCNLKDLGFLLKLKSLIYLRLLFSIDIEFIPKVLEELKFLSSFDFEYYDDPCKIKIDHSANDSKQFTVWRGFRKETKVSDVNAVVEWIKEIRIVLEFEESEDEESEDEE